MANADSEATLLDQAQALQPRLRALELLVDQDPVAAVPILLRIGERTDEPVELLATIGAALASLYHRGIRIKEFDMRDLSQATEEGFDNWMPPSK